MVGREVGGGGGEGGRKNMHIYRKRMEGKICIKMLNSVLQSVLLGT